MTFIRAGVNNWTFEQFSDFHEPHGNSWMTELRMIAAQYQ